MTFEDYVNTLSKEEILILIQDRFIEFYLTLQEDMAERPLRRSLIRWAMANGMTELIGETASVRNEPATGGGNLDLGGTKPKPPSHGGLPPYEEIISEPVQPEKIFSSRSLSDDDDIFQLQISDQKLPDEDLYKLRQTIAKICGLETDQIHFIYQKEQDDKLLVCLAAKSSAIEALGEKFQSDRQARRELGRFLIDVIDQVEVPSEKRTIKLTNIQVNLIRLLFAGYQRVQLVKPFTGGLGGAIVLLTKPIQSNGRPAAEQIVKLEQGADLAEESRRAARLKRNLDAIMPTVSDPVSWQGWTGLTYTFLGGPLGETRTFEEYFRDLAVSTKTVVDTLTHLLKNAMGRFLYDASEPHHCDFADEYLSHFGETLKLEARTNEPEGIWPQDDLPDPVRRYAFTEADAAERKSMPGDTVEYERLKVTDVAGNKVELAFVDNPHITVALKLAEPTAFVRGDEVSIRGQVTFNRHHRFQEVIRMAYTGLASYPAVYDTTSDDQPNMVWDGITYRNPFSMVKDLMEGQLNGRKSDVHGDLHVRNIMVDQREHAWLIDFAHVTERHNLFDFIKLETYIRQMILGEPEYEFSFAAYLQMEMALLDMRVDGQKVKPPEDTILKRSYQVIRTIREIAKPYAGSYDDFWKIYLPGLLLYNLAVLLYPREPESNAARLSFATATVLGKKLDEAKDA